MKNIEKNFLGVIIAFILSSLVITSIYGLDFFIFPLMIKVFIILSIILLIGLVILKFSKKSYE